MILLIILILNIISKLAKSFLAIYIAKKYKNKIHTNFTILSNIFYTFAPANIKLNYGKYKKYCYHSSR